MKLLLSPNDVIQPIREDYPDDGKGEPCAQPGKMWIPLTNYGRMTRFLATNVCLYFLGRRFVRTQKLFHCKCYELVFPTIKVHSSQRRKETNKKIITGRQWKGFHELLSFSVVSFVWFHFLYLLLQLYDPQWRQRIFPKTEMQLRD